MNWITWTGHGLAIFTILALLYKRYTWRLWKTRGIKGERLYLVNVFDSAMTQEVLKTFMHGETPTSAQINSHMHAINAVLGKQVRWLKIALELAIWVAVNSGVYFVLVLGDETLPTLNATKASMSLDIFGAISIFVHPWIVGVILCINVLAGLFTLYQMLPQLEKQ